MNHISSQMLKGTLSGSILILLSQKNQYGYELTRTLNQMGFGDISKKTIYGILKQLEARNLVDKVVRKSEEGPNRKYYYLTLDGYQEKVAFTKQWEQLKQAVDNAETFISSN